MNGPQPFGLTLGKTEKGEASQMIKKEGGTIEADERRRPATSIWSVKGLKIDHLAISNFWFYLNVLYGIEYKFYASLDQEIFFELVSKLKTNYGEPVKYNAPHYSEAGLALWKFGDVDVEVTAPWVSEMLCLEYRHVPLFRESVKEEKSLSYTSEKKEIKTHEKGL